MKSKLFRSVTLLALVIVTVLVAALILMAVNRITLSFLWMFIVLCILLLIPHFINGTINIKREGNRYVRVEDNPKRGNGVARVKNPYAGFLYSAIIFGFGIFAIIVLNRYFNPDESVFRNNDHYALRVDGLNINSPGNFVIAGNSEDAFFDRLDYDGRLRIHGVDSTAISIRSEQFSNPVYVLAEKYDAKFKCNRYEIANADFLPVFHEGDSVTLVSSHGQRVSFSICTTPPNRRQRPHTHYIAYGSGAADTAEFHTFLQNGYPLKSILANTRADNIDLSGITIARTVNYPAIKPQKAYNAYKDVPFVLILPAESEVNQVIINGNTFRRRTDFFSIPMDRIFYVGFGGNKSKPSRFHLHDNILSLEFDMPEYQFLSSISDAPESTVMFTSSIINQDGTVINDISDNVLLFEMFSHPGNIYNFQPHFLSFRTGKSGEELVFSLFSTSTNSKVDNLYSMDCNQRMNPSAGPDGKYGYYFPGISCRDRSTWNITAENFKETSPTRCDTIILIIFLVSLISAVMISVSTGAGPLFTKIEYAAYLLIIAFLSIRLFLMWRISVFPPVHGISRLEFNKFIDYGHSNLKTIILSLLFFYIVVGLAKLKYVKNGGKLRSIVLCGIAVISVIALCLKWTGLIPLLNSIPVAAFIAVPLVVSVLWFYYYASSGVSTIKDGRTVYQDKWYGYEFDTINKWIFVIGYILVCFIILFSKGSTTVNLLVPLLFYIIIEILIKWSNPAREDVALIANQMTPVQIDRFKQTDRASFDKYNRSIRMSLILSIANTFMTAILLLAHDGGYGSMFLVFAVLYSTIQVFYYFRASFYPSRKTEWLSGLIISLAILFIAFYKSIMIWLMDLMLCKPWIPVIVISAGVSMISLLAARRLTKRSGFHYIIPVAVLIVSLGVGLWLSPSIADKIDGSHTEYRIRVQKETAEEILANDISNDNDERKFSQASLNDWIIHEYNEYGKQVHPLSSSDKSFFVLQPQSKVGAMWFAQTTDISLVRYIIAEHSEWLALAFILAFIFALVLSLFSSARSSWPKAILVMIPLLLAVQSTMIWMANTQRFIFFGQDFPLISITSNFATLYFVVLMLFWVMAALVGDQEIMTPFVPGDNVPYLEDYVNQDLAIKREKRLASRASVVIIAALAVLYFNGQKKSHEYDSHIYDYENLMAQASMDLQTINDNFAEFQRNRRANGRPVVYSTNMKNDIDEFFESYPLSSAIPDSACFTYRLLQNYIKRGSSHNSIQDVIHIHKEKRSDANGRTTTSLVFDIRDTYYRLKLPTNKNNEWKGNVCEYARQSADRHSFEINDDHEGYETAWISGKYLGDGKDVFLLKARGDATLFIRGNNCPVTVSAGNAPAAIVHEGENVYLQSQRQPLVINKKVFFARNILLNGQRSFIYPLQSKFFWARELAYDFKSAKEDPDSGDAVITLSSMLMRSIDSVYMSNTDKNWDKCIVVADGNGKVKALMDYKHDPKYRLNPNDARRISEVSDSLYLEGELKRAEGEKFFMSMPLLKMKKGPGSSQKPLLWTAVTTGYKTDFWESLKLAAISDYEEREGGNYTMKKYSNVNFLPGHPFRSISSDEGSGVQDVDLEFYMYKSSNYYNALMAYIGSFDRLDLGNDGDPLFSQVRAPGSKAEYDSIKPYVKMYGSNTLYHFNRRLPEGLSDPTRGLINVGFHNNFKYDIYGNNRSNSFASNSSYDDASLYPSLRIKAISKDGKAKYFPAVKAGQSYFRADKRNQGNRMDNAVRRTAIGSSTIWDITPLKMAEMYGKMISLNRNYHLTIDPDSNWEYEPFELDNGWRDMDEYLQMRRQFISGLNKVFVDRSGRGANGTAHEVFDGLEPDIRALFTGAHPRYFIYGKTGTINDGRGQDHLLAAVITNRDLENCSASDLQRLKFYVIYLADNDYSGGGWKRQSAHLISAIIKSEEFRNYMNEE